LLGSTRGLIESNFSRVKRITFLSSNSLKEADLPDSLVSSAPLEPDLVERSGAAAGNLEARSDKDLPDVLVDLFEPAKAPPAAPEERSPSLLLVNFRELDSCVTGASSSISNNENELRFEFLMSSGSADGG
jgi:hypothetical protein